MARRASRPGFIVEFCCERDAAERAAAWSKTTGKTGILFLEASLFRQIGLVLQSASLDLDVRSSAEGWRLPALLQGLVFRKAMLSALARLRERRREFASGAHEVAAPPARDFGSASLDGIEWFHVMSVASTEFRVTEKPERHLGIARDTLNETYRRRPPPALAEFVHSEPLREGYRVLLVEDHQAQAAALLRYLRQRGVLDQLRLDVVHVTSADEAIDLSTKAPPDVAIVDYHLRGGVSGLDYMRWVRASGLPTVLVGKTGDDSPWILQEFLRLGALDVWFVGAPSEPGLLLRDALRATHETRALAALEQDAFGVLGNLIAMLEASAAECRRRAEVQRVDHAIARVEQDLNIPLLDGLGQVNTPLKELTARAVQWALRISGRNESLAARQLRISRNRLIRIRRESPDDSEE